MKLLLDEMLSPRIAVELRQRGYDVIAVAESAHLRRLPDDDLFELAIREHRCVVSRNIADFRRLAIATLHAAQTHPGLILVSNRRFPDGDPHSPGRITAKLTELLTSKRSLASEEHWLG